jgi:phospholipase/carboxylesterase
LVSHGTSDTDLAFAAGENLRNWLQDAGGDVAWVPFEGGHQIPLAVWRQTRAFARRLTRDCARQQVGS